MSEDKKLSKIDIKELGFSKDQEAIEFVKKLRVIGTTIYYMTDGEDKKYFLGKFDEEIPILSLALKQKIEILEKKIENIETTIQELKALKSIEPLSIPKIAETKPQIIATQTKQEEITVLDLPKQELPKLGFKSRLEEPQETETTKTISSAVHMQTFDFKCPSCKTEFSVNVPKGKKIIEVPCPQCGFTVYKKKGFWTRRKKIAVGLAILAFIIWLFTP
jgi:endogenous inhibitor of DNA gyrase (YacG/DUF329 family)